MTGRGGNGAFDDDNRFSPGTRVRITGTPIAVTLRSNLGVVVRQDRWIGCVIVRLDSPAIYHRADGADEELPEIREGVINLEVVDADHP